MRAMLCRGWHVLAEVHLGVWVLELMGLGSPAAIGTWVLSLTGEHSLAILAVVFVAILAATIVIALAAAGSHHENPANAIATSSVTFPQERQIPGEPLSKTLAPVDIYYIHDDEPGRGYPHKLCIALKNESGRDLVVNPAKWERRSAADIAFRRLQRDEQNWIPEGPEGWEKRNWIWSKSSDGGAMHVPRGRAILTWVGLHERVDYVEVIRRILSKRIGRLTVPLTIDGQATTETIEL